MRTGIVRIAAERQRQIDVEGWTPEHDDEHFRNELSLAAICYAAKEPVFVCRPLEDGALKFRDPWPETWDRVKWDKRTDPNGAGRIRSLEKAGALIAAEIDRLQREKPDILDTLKELFGECQAHGILSEQEDQRIADIIARA